MLSFIGRERKSDLVDDIVAAEMRDSQNYAIDTPCNIG